MKKEKLFKIGVINESTIDVVKDMTTFYTSDTELWLGFELSEEGVEFDSAEILMFNIDNKSFVVRSVVKIDNKYWYELDMDMIAHHGQWKAQLQFTKNSEVYTSKHFNFRIENDFSNERPPQLVDITNWSNIKMTADSLISEMKVAVTEAIAAEQNRAEAFTQAEQSRQTVFDGNEAIRTETFNTNEATRQENESTRQQAESQRQLRFETNESERQNTFETAELTRQQEETQRASAESSRVIAEEQRKTDHANRSAELAGKADKKQEDWITPTLVNGWVSGVSNAPRFRKDDFGNVYVTGTFAEGSGTIFTLPQGYRPVQRKESIVNAGGGFGILRVHTDGVVSLLNSQAVYVVADNVIFSVD